MIPSLMLHFHFGIVRVMGFVEIMDMRVGDGVRTRDLNVGNVAFYQTELLRQAFAKLWLKPLVSYMNPC